LFSADPVVGEVDRLRQLTVGLSWCVLAEGTVGPGRVVVQQVLGQHPSQVVLIDDQQPVEDLLLAVTLFAHDSATFDIRASAGLGVDGWPIESVAAAGGPVRRW
jgi:hypothetical protein